MEIDYVALGKRMKQARNDKKMTQQVLAEMVNAGEGHVSNVENANTSVSLPLLASIAEALDVTVDELIIDSYPEKKRSDIMIRKAEMLIEQCDAKDREIVIDTVKSLIDSLQKRKEN